MQSSIATVCLGGGLHEKLAAIAAAGFYGVEIFEADLLSYNGTPTNVAREIADLGLKTITFQPFRDFEGMPDARRARTFDRTKRSSTRSIIRLSTGTGRPTRLTAAFRSFRQCS